MLKDKYIKEEFFLDKDMISNAKIKHNFNDVNKIFKNIYKK